MTKVLVSFVTDNGKCKTCGKPGYGRTRSGVFCRQCASVHLENDGRRLIAAGHGVPESVSLVMEQKYAEH